MLFGPAAFCKLDLDACPSGLRARHLGKEVIQVPADELLWKTLRSIPSLFLPPPVRLNIFIVKPATVFSLLHWVVQSDTKIFFSSFSSKVTRNSKSISSCEHCKLCSSMRFICCHVTQLLVFQDPSWFSHKIRCPRLCCLTNVEASVSSWVLCCAVEDVFKTLYSLHSWKHSLNLCWASGT